MRALVLVVAFALSGCPHPTPPPTPPPDAMTDGGRLTLDAGSIDSCPSVTSESPDGVCVVNGAALFTADGHACVLCQSGQACIDHTTEVYCVLGGACENDPACHPVADMPGDRLTAVRKRLLAKIPTTIASCPAATAETPENVCSALFTADGHACVRCTGGKGCIDHSTEVYCISTSTCRRDTRCHHVNTALHRRAP